MQKEQTVQRPKAGGGWGVAEAEWAREGSGAEEPEVGPWEHCCFLSLWSAVVSAGGAGCNLLLLKKMCHTLKGSEDMLVCCVEKELQED